MSITIGSNELDRMIAQHLPHQVRLKGVEAVMNALEWCEDSMGVQYACYVSGNCGGDAQTHTMEECCYKVRHSARWLFRNGVLYFACRGDALYVKLKWGGTDLSE
jgi:hypothetical protein